MLTINVNAHVIKNNNDETIGSVTNYLISIFKILITIKNIS